MKLTLLIPKLTIVAAFLLGSNSVFALATQHTYHFQASGFSNGAPADSIVGSIIATFDKDVAGSGIVDDISLTIGAHTFTTSEVGFETGDDIGGVLFGGFSCAVDCIGSGTNDFWLYLNDFSDRFSSFAFSIVTGAPLGYFSYASHLAVTESEVPEPGALALIALGLASIVVARKRN